MENETSPKNLEAGEAIVRALEDGRSFWQPVPANGFVRCLLESAEVKAEQEFSIGTQTIAPGGCYVRTHAHDVHEEILFFLDGRGRIEIDDAAIVEKAEPGTLVYVGRNRRHSFINEGDEPLTFLWLLMPSGIEKFFSRIGRVRRPEDEAPPPFPRPENIAQIEAETVFAKSQTLEQKE